MARRKLYPKQYEQYDEDDKKPKSRGIFWLIFCGPGAMLMWFEYMFPSRGQVYASGRRYGNRFVQFLYTLVFYASLGYTAFIIIMNVRGHH